MSLLVPEPSPGGGLIMIQQEQHIAIAINTNIGASTAGQFQFTVWSTLTIMKMIGNSRTINIKKNPLDASKIIDWCIVNVVMILETGN